MDEESVPVVDNVVPGKGVGARYTLPGYSLPKVRPTTLRTLRTCFPYFSITLSLPLLARAVTHLLPRSITSLTTYTHLEGLTEAWEEVMVCGGVRGGGEGTGSGVLGEGTNLGGSGGSATESKSFFIPSGNPHIGQVSTFRCVGGEASLVVRGGCGGGGGGQFGGGVGRPPRLYLLKRL